MHPHSRKIRVLFINRFHAECSLYQRWYILIHENYISAFLFLKYTPRIYGLIVIIENNIVFSSEQFNLVVLKVLHTATYSGEILTLKNPQWKCEKEKKHGRRGGECRTPERIFDVIHTYEENNKILQIKINNF